MTFVVDKEVLGQMCLQIHRFFPVSVISAVPYAPRFLNTALVGRKSEHTLETYKQSKEEKHFEIFHSMLDRAE